MSKANLSPDLHHHPVLFPSHHLEKHCYEFGSAPQHPPSCSPSPLCYQTSGNTDVQTSANNHKHHRECREQKTRSSTGLALK